MDLCWQSNASAFQHTVWVCKSFPVKKQLSDFMAAVTICSLEPKKRKSLTTSTFSPFIWHEVMGLDAMILAFLIFSLKLALSLSSFTLIKKLFSFPHLLSLERWHPHIWDCCSFLPISCSRFRKEYDKAVCCHPVCLIYMLSTWWETPSWMSYKLESK